MKRENKKKLHFQLNARHGLFPGREGPVAFQREECPPFAWGVTGRDCLVIIRGPEEGKAHMICIPNCAMRPFSQMVFKSFFHLRYLPFYR